jgi:ATP-binding cassette subfamily C (CFTR/MRP) protein 1
VAVSFDIYWVYIKNCGVLACITCIILLILAKSGNISADWWISVWSQDATLATPAHSLAFYLAIFAILSTFTTLLTVISQLGIILTSVHCSKLTHAKLLERISHAYLAFFDQTPTGRILNRFTSDMDTIDRNLSDSFFSTIFQFLILISSLILQVSVTPVFLLGIIPLFIIFYFIQRFYRRASVELQRLMNISKSPVFAHFSASLDGLATIRAYRMQQHFSHEIAKKIDSLTKVRIFLFTSFRWLGVSLEFISSVALLVAALAISLGASYVPAGLAGLALSYTLTCKTRNFSENS